ncbi:uncharacterized protein SPAPADRAFT_66727 [Spathaspora passalidarum NRRL Y-27907]|uniref:Uncharacterized protein n=1 Tax=Spathaspora passalidarum (strain NRRL Y-27907 / 11-Y1) TaxID=619300 RepID=G3AP32_SPAPN|nr:uncharacterized protein SPAPADRAFT_66727 [Spathaspora passalidarum NRRL Y-27907]EGW32063.1 hypothetical protein SPAPADRAFT_66727 [Spathaspora passalidarum NRRL Y-27907]
MNGLEYLTGDGDTSPKSKPPPAKSNVITVPVVSSVVFPTTTNPTTTVDPGANTTNDNTNTNQTLTASANGTSNGTAPVTPKDDTTVTAPNNGAATISNQSSPALNQTISNQISTPPTSSEVSTIANTSANVSNTVSQEVEDPAVKNTRLLKEASELFAYWKDEINKTFIPAYAKEPVPSGISPQQWLKYISVGLRHFRGVSAYFRDPEHFELKERCVMNLGITNAYGNIEQYRKLLELLDDTFVIHLFNVGPQFIEALERQLGGKNARMKDILEFLDKNKPLVVVEQVIERKLVSFWSNLESKLGSACEILKFFGQQETQWNRLQIDPESKEDDIIDEFLNKVLPFQFKVVFRCLKGTNYLPVQKQYCKILAEEYHKWKSNKKEYVVIKYKTISGRISVPAHSINVNANKQLQFLSAPPNSNYKPGPNTYIRSQEFQEPEALPAKPVTSKSANKPANKKQFPVTSTPADSPNMSKVAAPTPIAMTYPTSGQAQEPDHAQSRTSPTTPAAPAPRGPRNSISSPDSQAKAASWNHINSVVDYSRPSSPPLKKSRPETDSYRPGQQTSNNYASKTTGSYTRGNGEYNDTRGNIRSDHYDSKTYEYVKPRSDSRTSDRLFDNRSFDSWLSDNRSFDDRVSDNRFDNRLSDRSYSDNYRPNGRSDGRFDETRTIDRYQPNRNITHAQNTSTDHRPNTNPPRKRPYSEDDDSNHLPARPTVPTIHPDRLKQVPSQVAPKADKFQSAAEFIQLAMSRKSSNSGEEYDAVDPNTVAISNARVFGSAPRRNSIYNPPADRRNSTASNGGERRIDNNSRQNSRSDNSYENTFPSRNNDDDTNHPNNSRNQNGNGNVNSNSNSNGNGHGSDDYTYDSSVSSNTTPSSRGNQHSNGDPRDCSGSNRGRRGSDQQRARSRNSAKGRARNGNSAKGRRGGGNRGGYSSNDSRPTLHDLLKSGGRLPND